MVSYVHGLTVFLRVRLNMYFDYFKAFICLDLGPVKFLLTIIFYSTPRLGAQLCTLTTLFINYRRGVGLNTGYSCKIVAQNAMRIKHAWI